MELAANLSLALVLKPFMSSLVEAKHIKLHISAGPLVAVLCHAPQQPLSMRASCWPPPGVLLDWGKFIKLETRKPWWSVKNRSVGFELSSAVDAEKDLMRSP